MLGIPTRVRRMICAARSTELPMASALLYSLFGTILNAKTGDVESFEWQ